MPAVELIAPPTEPNPRYHPRNPRPDHKVVRARPRRRHARFLRPCVELLVSEMPPQSDNDPKPDITRLLHAVRDGGEGSQEELFRAVYVELRSLARLRMARTPPGNTLQATALVHEAWIRLEDSPSGRDWNSRAHFFCAAAEAMRQILVDQSRRKASLKRGGERARVEMGEGVEPLVAPPSEDVLALNEALEKLKAEDPERANIVLLRYFSGLTREETAEILGMPLRTMDRHWRYLVARLHRDMTKKDEEEEA